MGLFYLLLEIMHIQNNAWLPEVRVVNGVVNTEQIDRKFLFTRSDRVDYCISLCMTALAWCIWNITWCTLNFWNPEPPLMWCFYRAWHHFIWASWLSAILIMLAGTLHFTMRSEQLFWYLLKPAGSNCKREERATHQKKNCCFSFYRYCCIQPQVPQKASVGWLRMI